MATKIIIEKMAAHILETYTQKDLDTIDMVQAMRQKESFAAQVARTVCETHKMSQKQAVAIAKGLDGTFKTFLGYCPSDCFQQVEGEYVSE